MRPNRTLSLLEADEPSSKDDLGSVNRRSTYRDQFDDEIERLEDESKLKKAFGPL